ncbi:MAG: hypothetical protein IT376_16690 [Polyangiaceae bacterium]|nr:hypothetical protein [Polyangiaceae bacterium]
MIRGAGVAAAVSVSLAAVGFAVPVRANPAAPELHRLSLGVGLDRAASVDASYSRRVDAGGAGVRLGGRWVLPWRPDLADGALGVSASRVVPAWGWGWTPSLTLELRWGESQLLRAHQLAVQPSVEAGWFAAAGWITAEVAWDHSVVTHVEPTAWYRRTAPPEARGGWYGSGGGTLRAGLRGGVDLAAGWELGARAGGLATERLGATGPTPWYGWLELARRL